MDDITNIIIKNMKVNSVSFEALVTEYNDKFHLINFKQFEDEYGTNVATSFLYHFFEKYINENKLYSECDDILSKIDFDRIPKYLLLAIIKYTKPYKKELKNRLKFITSVKKIFGNNVKSIEKLLK